MEYLLKVLISSLIIVTVSEVGKRAPLFSAILVALPITSILAMIFLYHQSKDVLAVVHLSYGIFWCVLPTLAFFLFFPLLVRYGLGFWSSLGVSMVLMVIGYVIYVFLLKKLAFKF